MLVLTPFWVFASAVNPVVAGVASITRVVPGFCRDRMPSSETIRLTGVRLPTNYPAHPQDVDATLNGSVRFHPLQAMLPYLVALDNRAQLRLVSAQTDGVAIATLITYLDNSHRIQWRDGIASLVYDSPADGVPAPFVSSMTQSGLAYLASVAFLATRDPYDLKVARAALRSFLVGYQAGGVRVPRSGGGAWYEEYASPVLSPHQLPFVLNGFLYALDNLAKMLAIGMEDRLPELTAIYADGKRALADALPAYETGFGWTFYDATGQNRATASYHSYQTLLLRELACHDGDSQLRAVADRWWTDYRSQLPFRLLGTSNSSYSYAHFAGIFPHAYLRDENATRLIAVDGRGKRTGINVQSVGPYRADSGEPELDTATLPGSTRAIEVWWLSYESILGLPNLYRVDTLVTSNQADAAPIGSWVSCGGGDADLGPLIAPVDTLAVNDADVPAGRPGADVCVRLDARFAPARITLALSVQQIQVANRASSVAIGSGSRLATVSVTQPGALRGYQANQATILLTGFAIDPTTEPLLELPISYSHLVGLTIDGVAADGTRISRYMPSGDRSVSGQPLIVTWPSFPGYSAKIISSIVIRASVTADFSGTIELGEPTVTSGTDGMLTDWDSTDLGAGVYRLTEREPKVGIGYAIFSRVNPPAPAQPHAVPGTAQPQAVPGTAPTSTGVSLKVVLLGSGVLGVISLALARMLRRRLRHDVTVGKNPARR
jgi:hypothetical protein